MRISDWSSDVCSSDLLAEAEAGALAHALGGEEGVEGALHHLGRHAGAAVGDRHHHILPGQDVVVGGGIGIVEMGVGRLDRQLAAHGDRKEHTSELQSLMRISYAVFCLKKKTKTK